MNLSTKIESLTVDGGLGPIETAVQRVAQIEAKGQTVLRWGLLSLRDDRVEVELAIADAPRTITPLSRPSPSPGPSTTPAPASAGIATAIVVPTGVGARIGGFIGDAGPLTMAVEAVSDVTIVHPNVVNGGDFYGARRTAYYVDGYTLDRFFAGEVRLLRRSRPRRIGLLIEKMAQEEVDKILNATNALRAICGVDIVAYAITTESISARVVRSPRGHFVGKVENAEVLLTGVEQLRAAGADAIAVVTTCGGTTPSDWSSHYFEAGPNPVGALEALISRYITHATGLTCAHAPAYVGGIGHSAGVVDPRAAGELASGTGLPCLLLGLVQAPEAVVAGGIGVEDLTAIVVPHGCAGGAPALAASRFGVRLLAIRSNDCLVGVAADALGVPAVVVETPAEAVAWLACARAGIAWELLRATPARIGQAAEVVQSADRSSAERGILSAR